MYFVTYQYNEFSEGGILTADETRVLPITTIGKLMGLKFPERLIDFIPLATDELLDDMKKVMTEHSNLGINLNLVKLLAPIPKTTEKYILFGKKLCRPCQRNQEYPIFGRSTGKSHLFFQNCQLQLPGRTPSFYPMPKPQSRSITKLSWPLSSAKKVVIFPKKPLKNIFSAILLPTTSLPAFSRKNIRNGTKVNRWIPSVPWVPESSTKMILTIPFDLDITCRVNGEMRQHSNTGRMIFDIPTIISDLSQGMTLLPGDIILTGTPAGVGFALDPPQFLHHGDVIEAAIEKIGILRNTIE